MYAYGAGTKAGHRNQVHWAVDGPVSNDINDPSLLERAWGAVKNFGSSVSNVFRNMAADLFEKPLNGLGSMIPDQFEGLGEFGKIPKSFYNTVKDKLIGFVRGSAESKDGASGSSGAAGDTPFDISGGAEQWRDHVLRALQMTGHDPSEADIVLKQIDIESSGNPNALNDWDINAQNGTPSKGLIQTIDPTFQAYRDPSLPDNPYDPLANIVAGIRYADATYGDIKNIWPKTMGYDAGGILPDDAMALNTSGKPEAVFTNDEWQMLKHFADLIGRPDFIEQLEAVRGGPEEMPKDSALAAGMVDPGPGNYGTGAGTVAADGYTIPEAGVEAGLQSFDKIHGTGGGVGSGYDVGANARRVIDNSVKTYGEGLPGIAKTALGGWIPDELLDPGGLVGGLLGAGKELFNWYSDPVNTDTSKLANLDPASIVSGFLGGGVPTPTQAPLPAAQAMPAVDNFVRNAPAPAMAGTTGTGDQYVFQVTNIDEAFRKFQQVQSRKAAGFMPR
jgi:hypothetical protein